MSIELRTFASGDTDYISKMNANVAALKAAIDNLQLQAGGASGVNEITVGAFWDSLFNNADCIIGPDSYKPVQSGNAVTVSPGGFYLKDTRTPVSTTAISTLTFTGQTAGTYYIVIDGGGAATLRNTQVPGTAYSVAWTGSAFVGQPVRIAQCLFDAAESTASRESTTMGALDSPPEDQIFKTLDERLETIEDVAMQARENADNALTIVYEAGLAENAKIRKVGCTVNNLPGAKGAIQVDFAGKIIGWSVIADIPGNLSVSVSKRSSLAPPAAPGIPNITGDKISAAAPIRLAGAQSGSQTNLATWAVNVAKWDVIQFAVDVTASVNYATVQLRIEEQVDVILTQIPE